MYSACCSAAWFHWMYAFAMPRESNPMPHGTTMQGAAEKSMMHSAMSFSVSSVGRSFSPSSFCTCNEPGKASQWSCRCNKPALPSSLVHAGNAGSRLLRAQASSTAHLGRIHCVPGRDGFPIWQVHGRKVPLRGRCWMGSWPAVSSWHVQGRGRGPRRHGQQPPLQRAGSK